MYSTCTHVQYTSIMKYQNCLDDSQRGVQIPTILLEALARPDQIQACVLREHEDSRLAFALLRVTRSENRLRLDERRARRDGDSGERVRETLRGEMLLRARRRGRVAAELYAGLLEDWSCIERRADNVYCRRLTAPNRRHVHHQVSGCRRHRRR